MKNTFANICKTIISLLLFITICTHNFISYADETVKVRRGDSWQSIANKYGINASKLKYANGNISECYLGMEVIIPDSLIEQALEQKRKESERAREQYISNQFDHAKNLVSLGKLKEAKKTYDQIIKEYPTTNAYYFRGLVEYNRHKWNSAMKDFSYVLTQEDADYEMKKEARSLYSKAEKNQAIADAEKAQLIGNLFNIAANTAGVIVGTIAENKATKQRQQELRQSNTTSTYNSTRSNYSNKTSTNNSHNNKNGRSRSSYKPNSNTTSKSKTGRTRKTYTPNTNKSYTQRTYTYTGGPNPSKRTQSNTPSNKLSLQEQYDKYLSPEAFVYNYTHGLPTLPTATEIGVGGTDAYAYNVQRNLQHRDQIESIALERQTTELIAQGMKKAEEEIVNFSSIYGREPTAEDIDAIYKKYTQGYMDAYTTYVTEKVKNDKELGLESNDIPKKEKKDVQSSDKSSTTETSYISADADRNKEKKNDNTQKEDSPESPKYGRYIQRIVNVYDISTGSLMFRGKIYEKGPVYHLKIGNDYYKINKSSKPRYSHKIMYGHIEYYFNM